jgi:hypothetical protein
VDVTVEDRLAGNLATIDPDIASFYLPVLTLDHFSDVEKQGIAAGSFVLCEAEVVGVCLLGITSVWSAVTG